jgi:hypothetical protein
MTCLEDVVRGDDYDDARPRRPERGDYDDVPRRRRDPFIEEPLPAHFTSL